MNAPNGYSQGFVQPANWHPLIHLERDALWLSWPRIPWEIPLLTGGTTAVRGWMVEGK